jgi:hypothetical protein
MALTSVAKRSWLTISEVAVMVKRKYLWTRDRVMDGTFGETRALDNGRLVVRKRAVTEWLRAQERR